MKNYEKPKLEIVLLDEADLIATSNGNNIGEDDGENDGEWI